MLVAAQLIGIPGTQAIGIASLALGMGWVVICLNAMRIGLLTRFMGVLGVICGALIVLPILSPLPIVQTFWLGAMAVAARRALAQRRPARVDDRRGRAVAEPGRGAREAPGRDAAPPRHEPDAAPEPEEPAAERPLPASKRKKRKRRLMSVPHPHRLHASRGAGRTRRERSVALPLSLSGVHRQHPRPRTSGHGGRATDHLARRAQPLGGVQRQQLRVGRPRR